MSSEALLDPELKPFLEASPTMDLTADLLPKVRAARAAMQAQLPPLPEGVSVEQRFIKGAIGAPDVRVKLYRKTNGASARRPVLLHLHGGGYIMGDPESMAPVCAHWASTFDCVVIAPAYRLAPETAFPGNVEDAYAALAWIYAEADALGVDLARVGLAGESAGGGLAAGLALLARDRGDYRFCYQHLIFPMLDDRTAVREVAPVFGEFVWTRGSNYFGWSSLLGQPPGSANVSPYAAAARAETLKGLPPTYIATGALDLFTEENLDYARRLMIDGVATELHVYPGAPHAFMWQQDARVTQQYMRDAMGALARGLGVTK